MPAWPWCREGEEDPADENGPEETERDQSYITRRVLHSHWSRNVEALL